MNHTVVLIGAGPIGLMIAEVAKNMGASKVIVVNRSKPRLEMAQKLGLCDVAICSNEEDPVARVLEETGGLGANVIFTANPSGESQSMALKMAVNRARINLFGGLPKDKSIVAMDNNIIHYKELIVSGAHGSMPQHHELAVDLIGSGRIDISKFKTHNFELDNILEAIKTAEQHAGLRVVVNPNK